MYIPYCLSIHILYLLPIHTLSTRYKQNTNLIIPRLRISFAQSGPDYVFVNFCVKFKINPHNFYYLHHSKKTAIIYNFSLA